MKATCLYQVQKTPNVNNRSVHTTSTQPKQKYMSFIKNKNLSIDVPDEHERITPAPISNTNRSLKNRHLELTKTSDSKSLTTKNTQRVTFDFDDPSSYPLQPAGRIIIPNHESTK
jgi:hypothetical protein